MKNLYRITSADGVTLCFQVGSNWSDAIRTARHFYGFRKARHAEFVREAS